VLYWQLLFTYWPSKHFITLLIHVYEYGFHHYYSPRRQAQIRHPLKETAHIVRVLTASLCSFCVTIENYCHGLYIFIFIY
jgi:hypothetical protein